jgi:hypothetical protein
MSEDTRKLEKSGFFCFNVLKVVSGLIGMFASKITKKHKFLQ